MNIQLNKKIFIGLLFLCLNKLVTAQSVIDEDFLDNIEVNAKTLWADKNAAFEVNTVPDKYKNESAVIFGFKRNVTIDKTSRSGFLVKKEKSLMFYENVRFKIKLNDKNAVNAFTEVFFRYSDKTDGFSAKITKPNGTISNVSLNEAVSLESKSVVPEFFKSFFDQEYNGYSRYFKVAVPDLEPGDILEYVTITKNKLDVKYTGYIEFSPQYEICNKNYPILYNQITIETDEKSFFKSMALNGAPEFKKENATEAGLFRFVFTDYERSVEKDVNFINGLRVYPLNKFQVIYANKDDVKGILVGQRGELKSSFTKEELAKRAWEDYIQVGDQYLADSYSNVQKYADAIWAELKKAGAKDWSEKEYLEKAYYRVRHFVANRDNYLNDKLFSFLFGTLLYQKGIKSELVISISNATNKLSNVLFDDEIRYAVKLNNDFYFNCTDHSIPKELVESLLGNEAYIIEEPNKSGTQVIKPLILPDATINDNTAEFISNVTINKEMNTLAIVRTTTYTGISKNRNISDALKFTPYILDNYKYHGGKDPSETLKGAQYTEYEKSVKEFKEVIEKEKEKFTKEELQRDFSQKVTAKKFRLKSDGRSQKNSKLIYDEEFELAQMVRKAGKKYLVNVAGLVGSQLQIKKEERIRKYDINVGYARTLNWVINFKIPEGYTVEGVKELNTNIDNETGTFNCTAEEKNGTVVINIKKIYKNANTSKDKWPAMLEFIDAAYNSSFKYLLLKPKN